MKESAVVQSTAAALGKGVSSVRSASMKVMEQPAVAHATEAVGSSFKKLGASLSSLTRGSGSRQQGENMSPLGAGASNPP